MLEKEIIQRKSVCQILNLHDSNNKPSTYHIFIYNLTPFSKVNPSSQNLFKNYSNLYQFSSLKVIKQASQNKRPNACYVHKYILWAYKSN